MMTAVAGTLLNRESAYTTPRADVSALVPREAMRILDVGCSNGALGASLRAEVAGRRVVGIELDAGFARQAALLLDRVEQADLDAFDWSDGLGDERFDCIVFADVLEHLVDPQRHLRGALARLDAGGCIVLSLPNIRHVSALASIYGHGRFPRRDRGIFDATHLRWFTIADGRSLLVDTGLQIDAEGFVLRAGDRGGGFLNRMLNRLPDALQRWAPVREFLTYQFSLRARRPAALPETVPMS